MNNRSSTTKLAQWEDWLFAIGLFLAIVSLLFGAIGLMVTWVPWEARFCELKVFVETPISMCLAFVPYMLIRSIRLTAKRRGLASFVIGAFTGICIAALCSFDVDSDLSSFRKPPRKWFIEVGMSDTDFFKMVLTGRGTSGAMLRDSKTRLELYTRAEELSACKNFAEKFLPLSVIGGCIAFFLTEVLSRRELPETVREQ